MIGAAGIRKSGLDCLWTDAGCDAADLLKQPLVPGALTAAGVLAFRQHPDGLCRCVADVILEPHRVVVLSIVIRQVQLSRRLTPPTAYPSLSIIKAPVEASRHTWFYVHFHECMHVSDQKFSWCRERTLKGCVIES